MDAEYFLSKYKKGDFVVIGHFVTIFDSMADRNSYHAIKFHAVYSLNTGYVSVHLNGNAQVGIGCVETYMERQIRPATNKEKRTLLTAMYDSRHVRWNEETMCIENVGF